MRLHIHFCLYLPPPPQEVLVDQLSSTDGCLTSSDLEACFGRWARGAEGRCGGGVYEQRDYTVRLLSPSQGAGMRKTHTV